jgi:hypothetical protein
MKIKQIVLGVAVSVAAVSASAQQSSLALGVEGGWASIDQETRARSNGQLIANASGRTTTVTWDKGTYAGRFFLNFPVTKDFGVEAGYFMTGSLDTTYTNSAGSAKESYTASGFDAALVIKPETFNGFFLKAGMHHSEVEGEASVTIGGTRYALTESYSGSGWLVGGGYEWQVGNDKDLLARVSYTFYNKLGGMSDADASVFAFGIMMRF